MKNKLKKMLQKIIPSKIRAVSLSLVFFMMGRWLGTDTYFSVYVKEVIGNTWWVSVIWTILALVKLFSIFLYEGWMIK